MTLFTYYTTGSSPTNNSKEIFANRYGNSYPRSLLVAPRNSSSQVSCRKSSKPWADGRRISLKNIGVCLTNLPSTTFDTYQPPLANMYLRPPCLTWELATDAPSAFRPGASWGFSFTVFNLPSHYMYLHIFYYICLLLIANYFQSSH